VTIKDDLYANKKQIVHILSSFVGIT